MPAFLEIDMREGDYSPHGFCSKRELRIKHPSEFNDDWSEKLTAEDKKLLSDYFKSRQFALQRIDLIQFKVGGEETNICLSDRQEQIITFHVPRNSLMTSIRSEIMDDLLISNIPKVQLRGFSNLYQCQIIPNLTKYCDNGRVTNQTEMENYKRYYRIKSGIDWIKDELIQKFAMGVRSSPLLKNKKVLALASKIYFSLK